MEGLTVVSVLKNYTKPIGSIGENVDYSRVEDGDAVISGSLASLENKYGTAGLVVTVAEPIPLLEGEPSVRKVVQGLSEVVLRELRGGLSFRQRRVLFRLELDCDGMRWAERAGAVSEQNKRGDAELQHFCREHTGGWRSIFKLRGIYMRRRK